MANVRRLDLRLPAAPNTISFRCMTNGTSRWHILPCGTILVVALAMTVVGAGGRAAAGPLHEVRGGILAHDVPDLWSGFRREPQSIDLNVELTFSPSMPFLFGVLRPALGASINTRGGTSHGYLDARWEIDLGPRVFFATGLGAAIHDGETDRTSGREKLLGSRVLFHIPFELGVRVDDRSSVSIYFEHTSNANTQSFNEGLDRVGVRYGFRF